MKYGIITSVFAGLVFIGCSRDTSIQGPLLEDIYGEFTSLEDFSTNTNQVDFSTGEQVVFGAKFSKQVNWEIEIIGQASGATHTISGFGASLENNQATWDGRTTILPMFKQEACKATLVVATENFRSDTLDITILGERVTSGFVVADFETGINPGWEIFAQSGANMSFRIVQSPDAAQGNAYYDMGGEVPFDFLIGLIRFPATAYQQTYFPLKENPNDVFFNVFLYKPAGINNEIVLFQFEEDENGDGVYQPNEDMYSWELRGLRAGWQQVSIRYADLGALVNGAPASPAGNGVHEPHKLVKVSLLFLADPSSGYSQTYLDNVVFTEDQPFIP